MYPYTYLHYFIDKINSLKTFTPMPLECFLIVKENFFNNNLEPTVENISKILHSNNLKEYCDSIPSIQKILERINSCSHIATVQPSLTYVPTLTHIQFEALIIHFKEICENNNLREVFKGIRYFTALDFIINKLLDAHQINYMFHICDSAYKIKLCEDRWTKIML